MKPSVLTVLFTVAAHIVKDFVVKKPDFIALTKLILTDGNEIMDVVTRFKELPPDAWALDADGAQEAVALFRAELGGVADATKIDEILGQITNALPQIKSAINTFKLGGLEEKVDAVYIVAKQLVLIYNQVVPAPVP